MEHVYDVIMERFRSGSGVEGNLGVYRRVQRLQEILKEYFEKQLTDNER